MRTVLAIGFAATLLAVTPAAARLHGGAVSNGRIVFQGRARTGRRSTW